MYPFGEDEPRKPLVMIPSAKDTPLGWSRAGEYDRDLVCAECEAIFSPWDDYALRLLSEVPKDENRISNVDERYYFIPSYDYAKLKLFFISLLWRASESNRSFVQHVRVGSKHTAKLRDMIDNKDSGGPEDYSVYLVHLTHHDDAHKSVMSPYTRRWDGIRFWRFSFYGYMYDIKVDQRTWGRPMSTIILRPGEPLYVPIVRFDETGEYKAMVAAVRRSSF